MYRKISIRALWFSLGSLALILGLIGVVLPVLPTTPFIILAAFCFGKSAPSFAARLERHRVFGPMIADWRSNGAIAPRYKRAAGLMMGGAFAISVTLAMPVWVLLVQAVCLSGAAAYVFSRPDGPKRL